MRIAIPKESLPGETRVAAIPATVKGYVRLGAEVVIEAGAGVKAGIADEQFAAEGASVQADAAAVLGQADLVLKVRAPGKRPDGLDELAALKNESVLICLLDPATGRERLAQLAQRGIAALALELVPRITRAQSMDVLSSQSTVAGYKAMLLAANELTKMVPMLMTAAGTIHPANVVVIGAGVAGLQAVATAKRLGAMVRAVDTRPAVQEQVQSLGAKFIPLTVEHAEAEVAGGYAADLGVEYYRQEQKVLAPHIAQADIVITTALVPGRAAPRLITAEMVATMPPGAVIVDLAVAAGGNCALTKADQRVHAGGVTILGPTNLPAMVPTHASQMLARNLAALVGEIIKDGKISLDMENEIIKAMLVARGGQVLYKPR